MPAVDSCARNNQTSHEATYLTNRVHRNSFTFGLLCVHKLLESLWLTSSASYGLPHLILKMFKEIKVWAMWLPLQCVGAIQGEVISFYVWGPVLSYWSCYCIMEEEGVSHPDRAALSDCHGWWSSLLKLLQLIVPQNHHTVATDPVFLYNTFLQSLLLKLKWDSSKKQTQLPNFVGHY